MKILIVISFVVVFISAFFILFTMEALGERYLDCEDSSGEKACTMKTLDGAFSFGVSFIIFFLMLSLFTMYIIFKNLKDAVDS